MASASDADQMGAVEFAGQRIVPRQFQQLLVAGVALVVDADDALGARRPAVGAGEPAAGFLDPEHRRRGSWSARHIRSGRARRRRRARAANGRARPNGSSAPARSVSRIRRRWPAPPPEYPERPTRADRSRRSRRWRCPTRRRPGRAKRGWSKLAEAADVTDRLVSGHCRVILRPKDSACFAPDQRVFRQSGDGATICRKMRCANPSTIWKPRCAAAGNKSAEPAWPLRSWKSERASRPKM